MSAKQIIGNRFKRNYVALLLGTAAILIAVTQRAVADNQIINIFVTSADLSGKNIFTYVCPDIDYCVKPIGLSIDNIFYFYKVSMRLKADALLVSIDVPTAEKQDFTHQLDRDSSMPMLVNIGDNGNGKSSFSIHLKDVSKTDLSSRIDPLFRVIEPPVAHIDIVVNLNR